MENKDLEKQLKALEDKFREENDKLSKLEDSYHNQMKVVEDLKNQFERLENDNYQKYLGKYVVFKNDENDIVSIEGGLVTYVQSMGPGHDRCHISGVSFSYWKDYDGCRFTIHSADDGDRMYPLSWNISNKNVVTVYDNPDDYFAYVKKLSEQAMNAYIIKCVECSTKKKKMKIEVKDSDC